MAQNPNDSYREHPSSGGGQDAHSRSSIEQYDWSYEDWGTPSARPPRQETAEDYEYDYIFGQEAPGPPPTSQRRRSSGEVRRPAANQEGRRTAKQQEGRKAAAHQEGRRAAQPNRSGNGGGTGSGGGGERPPQKKKKKKKRASILKGLYVTIVILALIIVAGYGATKVFLHPPDANDPSLAGLDTLEGGAVPGLSGGRYPHREQTYTFLLVCPDQESGNADAIMIVTYDVPKQKIGMLSIPRDTLVNEKHPKINSSYPAGIDNLVRVVSDLSGLDFNFTVEIDLNVVAELVDQVGGIDFDVPVEMYYDDPTQDLSIHYQPGMQHLNGKQAVEVCRFRHNGDGTGYPLGDVQRSETVRNVMVTTAKKLVSFSNVTKVKEFIDIFQRNVTTNLKASDIIWFASQAMQMDLTNGITSGSLDGDGSVTYKGTKWCYELYPDAALESINTLVNPYTQSLTAQDLHIFQAP